MTLGRGTRGERRRAIRGLSGRAVEPTRHRPPRGARQRPPRGALLLTARRGFTLVELLVYLGLVSAALVVFGGIELAAQRSIALQQSLLDVNQQAGSCLGALRQDVEAARSLEVAPDRLEVLRLDGVRVTYGGGERLEVQPGGREHRRAYRHLETLRVEPAPGGGVAVRAEFAVRTGPEEALRRTYKRVATPRREVGP